MRWLCGDGPKYCRACQKAKRLAPTENCQGCNEPELLPDNALAARVYLQVQTQWRYSPAGHGLGFDWPGVEALLRLLEVERSAALTEQLLIIEREILALHAEHARRGGDE